MSVTCNVHPNCTVDFVAYSRTPKGRKIYPRNGKRVIAIHKRSSRKSRK